MKFSEEALHALSAADSALLANSGRRSRIPPKRTRVQKVWPAQYDPGHALR